MLSLVVLAASIGCSSAAVPTAPRPAQDATAADVPLHEAAGSGEACGVDAPTLFTPVPGSTVSGTVAIEAWNVSDNECPLTIGVIYRVRSRSGALVVEHWVPLLEAYHWNTTSSPDGWYRITAQKSCAARPCGGTSEPVRVIVDNNP
jgi:hypothetical protein